MSHAARGGQTLLLKLPRTWVFIVKCVFRVIWGVTRSILSKYVTITLNTTILKSKHLPALQGTTSTGRVRSKILRSDNRHKGSDGLLFKLIDLSTSKFASGLTSWEGSQALYSTVFPAGNVFWQPLFSIEKCQKSCLHVRIWKQEVNTGGNV